MFKISNYKKMKIDQPKDLAKILMSDLSFKKEEIVKVAVLSSKDEILKIVDIAKGTTNLVTIPIKDVLYEPIRMKAPKFVLIHNHPSGDCTPSETDIVYTTSLEKTAECLDIKMVDHLIIGNMQYTSIFTEFAKEEQKKNAKWDKTKKERTLRIWNYLTLDQKISELI